MNKKIVARVRKFLKLESVKISTFEIVWLFAPIAIWFSFHPTMSFGQSDTLNPKLSITLIYAVILALVGLPKIWHNRHALTKDKSVWIVSIFVLWSGLSLFWTDNLLRGVLTFGVVGILQLIFLAALSERKKLQKILPSLVKIFIVMAVTMSIFAWGQMFAGIWLDHSLTLLCNGCVAEQFGFVRPNGFTIEPQFLGSLLIVPALILLWKILRQRNSWTTNAVFIFISSTLMITLSRGAIFAFMVGVAILLIQIFAIKNLRKISIGVGFIIMSMIVALSLQGLTTVINPNFNETFSSAIARSLNQISMGIIKINVNSGENESKTSTDEISEFSEIESLEVVNQQTAPNFDGYVEESTSIRLRLSELAIRTWAENSITMIAGIGIGGAGVAMNNKFPNEIGAREIVQNEFVEILLERGVVGAVIFVTIIIGLIYKTRQQKVLWAIIMAFLVQWNFFSGYPSALHIFLIFIVIFATADNKLFRATTK